MNASEIDKVIMSTLAELCLNSLRSSPARLYAATCLLRTADRLKAESRGLAVLRVAIELAEERGHG